MLAYAIHITKDRLKWQFGTSILNKASSVPERHSLWSSISGRSNDANLDDPAEQRGTLEPSLRDS
jgi:hypothetical protein